MRTLVTLILLLAGCCLATAQPITQTVKGRITDAQSQSPLPGATVVVVNSDPLIGSTTDSEGYFRLMEVPVGRQTVKVSFLGYGEQVIPNVLVTSGKEVVLNVTLPEQIITGQEVVVTAKRDPSELNNEFATLSARTFNVEETQRYAGSRNDPARMAANFAGVTGNNDSRNDIVIRGNSPASLLWRLEGIDIPNPSHYGALGATGGPVSILNNNVLDQSDFLTGAFPAQYGNAVGGVFDLQLRTGNRDKREYTGQIGFNGFEAGVEGPFVKGGKATYLANYRYSALSIVQKFGVNFGTGTAVPNFQDLSFRIDLPTTKAGRFSLFGVGGLSDINFKGDLKDTANFYNNPYENLYNRARMGVAGLTHTYYFNQNTYGKLVLATSANTFLVKIDSLDESRQPIPQYRDNSSQGRFTAHYSLNKKFSARNNAAIGIYVNRLFFNYNDSVLYQQVRFRPLRAMQGHTYLLQGYGQWQHRFGERLTMNSGLHYSQFTLNNTWALEPRVGFRYAFAPTQALTFGAGGHSQLQSLQLYFYQTEETGRETNRNLGFTRSNHAIAGYERLLGENIRLKVEAYYQALTQVPVERNASSFSTLNLGADFNTPEVDSLINGGQGRNYGLEVTAERFFSNNYYFLATLSWYESQYQGSDEIWRNTAFNGRYTANLLAGREFKLGEKNILAFDTRITAAGGRRYTPIDVEASLQRQEQVELENEAFTRKFKDYFRADVKVTFRRNGKRVMQEWFVDFQNILDNQNIFAQQFDIRTGRLQTQYQLGFFPNFNYRIQF